MTLEDIASILILAPIALGLIAGLWWASGMIIYMVYVSVKDKFKKIRGKKK